MKQLFVVSLMAWVAAPALAKKVKVDLNKSQLNWEGSKKFTNSKHVGYVKLKSGFLKFQGDKPKSGEFVVDLDTIVCTDVKNKDWNKKLVDHLKNEDFFHVKKHPVSTLTLTSITPQQTGKYKVKGKLTIRGVKKDVVFNADWGQKNGQPNLKAKFEIDRTQYNVKYNNESWLALNKVAKDKVINNKMLVHADIVLSGHPKVASKKK